jgi:hypothetical protein
LTSNGLQAAAPGNPAGRNPAFLSRRADAPRITLRPSATLHLALVVGIGFAAAAVHTSLAPWLGTLAAVPPALAFLGASGLAAAAWRRSQPAVIEIGPDSLRAYARDGARMIEGRLAGAAQWGSALLILAVEPGSRAGKRRTTVLVASDALDPEAFRTLAVHARCAIGR